VVLDRDAAHGSLFAKRNGKRLRNLQNSFKTQLHTSVLYNTILIHT
jgi:hypothetical protein